MAKAGRLIYEGFLIIWDGFWVVWLSDLLWLVFCLPLITAPLGFAGMYECVHRLVHGESITWKTFFSGIKQHFWASIRWAIFNLLVILILAFYVWFFSPAKGSLAGLTSSLLNGVPLALIVLWWIVNQFTFPFMLVQEKRSYRNALRNSLVMFLKWPGVTLGFTLFNLAVIALSLWLRFPWLVFGASLPALMACLCVKYSVDQTPDTSGADSPNAG
jgi:hypothetical protein